MAYTWLITGCSRGLGRATAEAVLQSGARLVATARNPEDIADFKDRFGDQVRIAAFDIADVAAAQSAVDTALEHFGGLDVLVNNAGFNTLAPFEQLPAEEFASIVNGNFFGVVNAMRAALPIMRRQRSGHIFNISSAAGRMGAPGQAAYCAAKFAISGFSESVAAEVAPLGIRVVAVEPGGIRTKCAALALAGAPALLPDYEAGVGPMFEMVGKYIGNEFGDPDKMAAVLVELARRQDLPARLLLGGDTLASLGAAKVSQDKTEELWAPVSRSTDFDGSDLSHWFGAEAQGAE